ncbi:hypothetical protein QUF54_05715, partial [Candidatus Marithioploca araucensis]|nr:hypothetical protein [Candidatus Marithioploca araucensis]
TLEATPSDGSMLTGWTGAAGNINIKLTGSLNLNPGGIFSSAQSYYVEGNGGNIQIKAREVAIQNGGMIAVETFGENAGNITITATDKIYLRETYDETANVYGGISASTSKGSIGKGGNINLNAPNLILDAGEIWALSDGNGNAGSITITTNTALLTNASDIMAESYSAFGGNIKLEVQDRLHVADNSWISAESLGDEELDSGGNITINKPQSLRVREADRR